MKILVRRVIRKDVNDLAPLFNDYRVFYGQPSNLNVAHDFISQRIENNESVIFLAQNAEGDFLGFTQLYPNFSSVSARRSWILNDLYVSPSARRAGVAKELMNTAKDFAASTNAKGISLETSLDNFNAQSLYESLGYEKSCGFYSYYLTLP